MKTLLKPVGLLFLAGILVTTTGCPKKPVKDATEIKPAPTATPTPEVTKVERDDFKTPKPTPTPEGVDITKESNEKISGYLKPVFFDFDKYDIRGDQRASLEANSEFLRKWSKVRFRIEGHCDERGTAQYNMALGERRANAVKDYLASLGVEASRMEIVSFGKERPFATGHDESAWSQNRRGHFVVTSAK